MNVIMRVQTVNEIILPIAIIISISANSNIEEKLSAFFQVDTNVWS